MVQKGTQRIGNLSPTPDPDVCYPPLPRLPRRALLPFSCISLFVCVCHGPLSYLMKTMDAPLRIMLGNMQNKMRRITKEPNYFEICVYQRSPWRSMDSSMTASALIAPMHV